MNNSSISYGGVAKFLHWTMAVLMLLNYFMGLTLDKNNLYDFHKQTGLCILALAVIRIIWRILDQYPAPLTHTMIERAGAKLAHLALYGFMIILPVSGILMVNSYGYPLVFLGIIHVPTFIGMQTMEISHVFGEIHKILANTMIAIVVIHSVAALKHHFIDKNDGLIRMLPFFRKRN